MSEELKNKRVLLLVPAFFGYEKKIKNAMESLGANVILFDERSVSSSLARALLKVCPSIFKKRTKQYYEHICNKNIEQFDYILVIKSDMVTPEIIRLFREKYPAAKICLHLWDSVKNIKGVELVIPLYDYCSSFDRFDCEYIKELHFRPLFFSSDFITSSSTELYDLSFCGTMHSDRYFIVKKIADQMIMTKKSFYSFLFLQSKFMFYYYKFIGKGCKKSTISDFSLIKLDSKEIAKIENSSKVILDIQHPNQTGLTMRTIEMIGMRKRFITTNNDIINYDFYNPNNIMIIDRNMPVIDCSFFDNKYKEIPKNIYDKYRIESWIIDVLGGIQ